MTQRKQSADTNSGCNQDAVHFVHVIHVAAEHDSVTVGITWSALISYPSAVPVVRMKVFAVGRIDRIDGSLLGIFRFG